jgi:putative addiction module antidote
MARSAQKPLAAAQKLQVRKIGNSVGLILPKEMLNRLRLEVGDELYVVEQAERSLKLTAYDPQHAHAMEIARKVMHEYADTLKALAK